MKNPRIILRNIMFLKKGENAKTKMKKTIVVENERLLFKHAPVFTLITRACFLSFI